uniref:pilus assembly protein PilP n=1 Tax=Ningiella ruwaisensis TaxID=2364274 RepID=UPI0010A09BDA|nr:pilus assembly protein PilP [Ningiella ruwaisensis]
MKRLMFGLASTLILSGCGASIDDLVAYTEKVKANTQVSIEPYPEFKEFESVAYSAANIRSPFQRAATDAAPVEVATTPNCIQPNRQRSKQKLERFGLDALQMSGVLSINGKRFALIKANDGSLHRVSVGSYLGLFHGKVMQITENEIKIREMLPDGAGCWQEKTATLSMSSTTGDNT